MPFLKRQVVELEATDTEPLESATDPFDGSNITEAIRMGEVDDFDEEAQVTADALGRDIDGQRIWQQEYFVREDSDSATTDELVEFCRNNDDEVWFRESYQEHESGGGVITKIIGAASSGCTVNTRKATVEGHVGTIIKVTSSAVFEEGNYRDEPTYTP